jgi:uncharacterized protein YjgD (DUF1641 family)
MSSKELSEINEKLDLLTTEVSSITSRFKAWQELKEDIVLFSNDAFGEVIRFLGEVDFHLRSQDFLSLLKKLLRNVNNIAKTLAQLESVMEFKEDITPLVKEIFNDVVEKLDKLERDGVLKSLQSLLQVIVKFNERFSPEDVSRLGDGLIRITAMANRLMTPENLEKFEKTLNEFEKIEFNRSRKVSLLKLLKKMKNPEILRSMDAMLEFAAVFSRLNNINQKGGHHAQ